MTSLLLLSLGTSSIPAFLDGLVDAESRPPVIGYLGDAARGYDGAPFVSAERQRIVDLEVGGGPVRVVDVVLAGSTADDVARQLDEVDAVYVAGGSTFALLAAIRAAGALDLVAERVRDGLPYIGLSAGSILAGPSIAPASFLDDPADAPELTDYRGLGLIDVAVIPHADGSLPPYPLELIERTVIRYSDEFPLQLLTDEQALLVRGEVREVVESR